jgi:hypothetical protein
MEQSTVFEIYSVAILGRGCRNIMRIFGGTISGGIILYFYTFIELFFEDFGRFW